MDTRLSLRTIVLGLILATTAGPALRAASLAAQAPRRISFTPGSGELLRGAPPPEAGIGNLRHAASTWLHPNRWRERHRIPPTLLGAAIGAAAGFGFVLLMENSTSSGYESFSGWRVRLGFTAMGALVGALTGYIIGNR